MAFKMVLDTLDGLPEEVAKEYVERDGKFHIQVEGMKTQADVDRVQSSLTKERADHNSLKEKVKIFGGRKFEDIQADLDRIPELEAKADGTLDDEKIDKIVESRVRSKIAPVERERDGLKEELGTLKAENEGFKTRDRKRTIHDQVRTEAKKAGVRDEAIEDALLLADTVLELDDSGVAVVKEGTSFSQGLATKDWLADVQDKRPHWWGDSAGGGASGNRGNGNGAEPNPFTKDHWNLTKQGQIMASDSARADKLAKAAGHADAVSATKPEK